MGDGEGGAGIVLPPLHSQVFDVVGDGVHCVCDCGKKAPNPHDALLN